MKNIHKIKELNELLNYLNSLHPKYIDFNLDRLNILMEKLGNPEKKLPITIHIAGTNGKGSTLAFTKHIAEAHGLKVNCYTSPHLIKFNERIILNGKMIQTKFLFKILKEVALKNDDNEITFFEITTAAAFLAFSKVESDLCIIETGLGGRLDATNIIPKKEMTAITNIGYDHKEFLGNSLKKIIFEKCGILKKNIPVVIANQNSNYLKKSILFEADNKSNRILKLCSISRKWKLGLSGDHQYENAQTAVTMLKFLYKNLKDSSIQKGLLNTKWPGRLQPIENGRLIQNRKKITLIDGAHNSNGARIIRNYLDKNYLNSCIIILGMMKNKNANEFINILKKYIFKLFIVPIQNQSNCFNPKDLKEELKLNKLTIVTYNSLEEAINYTPNDKPVIITGSLYLMGEILSKN